MEDHQCKFEHDIGYIKATVEAIDKRINGSIDDIQRHITNGQKWRITIMTVALALILNVVAFAYMYGQLCQKVIGLERSVYAAEVK